MIILICFIGLMEESFVTSFVDDQEGAELGCGFGVPVAAVTAFLLVVTPVVAVVTLYGVKGIGSFYPVAVEGLVADVEVAEGAVTLDDAVGVVRLELLAELTDVSCFHWWYRVMGQPEPPRVINHICSLCLFLRNLVRNMVRHPDCDMERN